MAKGRTIQRDLFGSGDLIDLPVAARLLWVGLIVFADHEGRIRLDPRWLKNRILPETRTRLASIRHWIDTYAARDMIEIDTRPAPERHLSDSCATRDVHETRTSDVVTYGVLKNFRLYHGSTALGREGKVREEKGREGKGTSAPPPRSVQEFARDFKIRWNRLAKEVNLHEIQSLSTTRLGRLQARLREHVDFWSDLARELPKRDEFHVNGRYPTVDQMTRPDYCADFLAGAKNNNGTSGGKSKGVSPKMMAKWKAEEEARKKK